VRPKLTLNPRVDPATRPKVDPEKTALSDRLGWRFVDRGGRYISQRLLVSYTNDGCAELSRTWVDVPLVPEVYVG
jgi:hypothetical protein